MSNEYTHHQEHPDSYDGLRETFSIRHNPETAQVHFQREMRNTHGFGEETWGGNTTKFFARLQEALQHLVEHKPGYCYLRLDSCKSVMHDNEDSSFDIQPAKQTKNLTFVLPISFVQHVLEAIQATNLANM